MAETPAGFHFYSKYMSCARSWYIRYVLGLIPKATPRALSFGTAIHAALDAFRSDRRATVKTLTDAFATSMFLSKEDYADSEEFHEDLMRRGPAMLNEWMQSIGETFRTQYKLLTGEQIWLVPLYSGDQITVRLDGVVHHLQTGANFILETKTTSWSLTGAAEGVIEGDQATTYLLAAERVKPNLRISGVVPEVLYNKGKVTKVSWFEVIYRSQEELRDWEDQLVGLIGEVSQKRAALPDYPLGQLFPRNPPGCNYHHTCSYSHLCRTPPPIGEVPSGYKHDPDWVQGATRETHSTSADAAHAEPLSVR